MASGFGFQGGRSRCFVFWQEFQKCYANADSAGECAPQKEDYLECLHHHKEIARGKQLQEHFLARQAKEAKENRSSAEIRTSGSVMSLGLIKTPEEGKAGKESAPPASAGESEPKSKGSPSSQSSSE